MAMFFLVIIYAAFISLGLSITSGKLNCSLKQKA